MREVHREALVAYSAERMYALVDDVARYPEFLPWCRNATVHADRDGVMDAELDVARGAFRGSFRTRNTREPGRSIELALLDGPFRTLEGSWRFEPIREDGCRVRLHLRFEIRSPILRLAMEPVFADIADDLVDAFVARARDTEGTA